MKKMVVGLVLVLVSFLLLLFSGIIMFFGQAASDEEGPKGLETIVFTGEVKQSDITLCAEYSGMTIEGINGNVTDDGIFTANYSSDKGSREMALPSSPAAKLDQFTYMPQFDQSLYSYSLDKNSAQYIFNKGCTTDERGYRKKGNAYLIALGSYYGSEIGAGYQLTFKQEDGTRKRIQAVLGDQKADKDTDKNHQYHTIDGSVVEFIMGTRDNRNAQIVNEDFGTLVSIRKGGGYTFALTGKIQKESISISGTIDSLPVLANGTVKDGKIHATGYVGDLSEIAGGGIINGDVGEWKGGKLKWPLPGYTRITGDYGTNRGDHIHAGIDIGTQGATGVPCVAAGDGIIVKNVSVAAGGARGHYVDVGHGSNMVTRYQHLQPGTGLAVGTRVKVGQKVGIVGGSGFGISSAYAMHLHFEVLLNYTNGQGQATNPVPYLK